MPHVHAVLVAAGKSTRISHKNTYSLPKQFFPYKGKPLWYHSALALSKSPYIKGLVLVFSEETFELAKTQLQIFQEDFLLPISLVKGGITRQESVYNGIKALPPLCTHVAIHDGARPFVSTALVSRLVQTLLEKESTVSGIIPALPVTDTVKHIVADIVVNTPKRESLQYVQTPQIFVKNIILKAHEHAYKEAWETTDDAALLERLDIPVGTILGEVNNIKITHYSDLKLLEDEKMYLPISGFGYDVHAYNGNRDFKLGTVPIPTSIKISAHSDGDVLLHALMDALLSLISAGDIGQLFPDSQKDLENISSAILLDKVLNLLKTHPIKLTHIDLTIIAQQPKIAPHSLAIRKNIANLLNMPLDSISLKATTEEKLGFTGELKGIKAIALVNAIKLEKI